MYCSQCGKEIPENSKFCNECGSPVVETKEPEITITNSGSNNIYSSSSNMQEKINVVNKQESPSNQNCENHQFSNDAQQASIKKLEDIVASDSKFISKFILVIVVSIFLWFIPFIRNSKFLLMIMIAVSFGLFFIFAMCLASFFDRIKELKMAKNNYSKYLEDVMQKQQLEEKKRIERKKQLEQEEKTKQIIENRKAEYRAKGMAVCPKCGSPSISTINRGYSIVTGFIGSGKPVNVCQRCGHKWKLY